MSTPAGWFIHWLPGRGGGADAAPRSIRAAVTMFDPSDARGPQRRIWGVWRCGRFGG